MGIVEFIIESKTLKLFQYSIQRMVRAITCRLKIAVFIENPDV